MEISHDQLTPLPLEIFLHILQFIPPWQRVQRTRVTNHESPWISAERIEISSLRAVCHAFRSGLDALVRNLAVKITCESLLFEHVTQKIARCHHLSTLHLVDFVPATDAARSALIMAVNARECKIEAMFMMDRWPRGVPDIQATDIPMVTHLTITSKFRRAYTPGFRISMPLIPANIAYDQRFAQLYENRETKYVAIQANGNLSSALASGLWGPAGVLCLNETPDPGWNNIMIRSDPYAARKLCSLLSDDPTVAVATRVLCDGDMDLFATMPWYRQEGLLVFTSTAYIHACRQRVPPTVVLLALPW